MGRASMSEERREQIVEGLLEVMAEKGYERASVNAIAKQAGLTSGLVHYYFKTKQEILVALVDLLAQRLEARYIGCIEQAGEEPLARLDAFFDAYVGLGPGADAKAVACWVAIGAEAIRLPEVQEAYQRVLLATASRLNEHLTEALEAQGRETAQLSSLSAGLLAAVEGAYLLATAAPHLAPRGFAAPTLKQMARGLLAAQAPT